MSFSRHLARLTGAAALAAAGAFVAMLLTGEVPRWRGDGSRPVDHAMLADVGTGPIELGPGAVIICQGDSNTRGRRPALNAFPDVLAGTIAREVDVRKRGYGGDTVLTGAVRWQVDARPGDLVILMYGTNDAEPRGLLSRKRGVPLAEFRGALAELAQAYRIKGAQVLILAPLPAGSRAADQRIAPYRAAAREAAVLSDSRFLDPATALLPEGSGDALLTHDAIHLTDEGHRRLAAWLAGVITIG